MPAYNAGSTIKLSIESVLNQTYLYWELIIINDGSIDDTQLIINDYRKIENKIVVVNLKKNGGLPNARNEGLRLAKGEFIAFLDSDDIWYKHKLEKQIAFHDKYPNINISHCGFEIFNESGIIKRPFKRIIEFNYKKKGILIPSIYCKNTIGVLTVLIRRTFLNNIGEFDSTLWTMEDQDLWIRIAQTGAYFGYIDKKLAKYRLNTNSISNNVGKYKAAYKKLNNKYQSVASQNQSYKLVLSNYYRYFGIVYYKRHAYKLASLYLAKSLKLEKYILHGMLTSLLFFKAVYKHLTTNKYHF